MDICPYSQELDVTAMRHALLKTEALGQRIRARREVLGLTGTDLARRIGVTRSAVEPLGEWCGVARGSRTGSRLGLKRMLGRQGDALRQRMFLRHDSVRH